MWSTGAVLHMLATGGELPQQFCPLRSSNGSEAKLALEGDISEQASTLLSALLTRSPNQRMTAATAVKCCQRWHEVCKQCARDEEHVASSVQYVEIYSKGALPDVEKVPPVSEATIGLDGDFAIFDEFALPSKTPGRPRKQPVCKDTQSHKAAVLQEGCPTSGRKSCNTLRQSSFAIDQDCKENLGPKAPRVCKHAQKASHQQRRCNQLSVQQPRMMRA